MSSALAAAMGDFDGLPIPGVVMEIDGTIVAVNAAGSRLMARPVEQLLGKKAWDFAPGIDHIWMEILDNINRLGESRGQIAVATPLGPRTIQYVATVRHHESRALLVAYAVEQDTETAADDRTKQRVEALGLVASGIAHDFNNQLVTVIAEASAAREEPGLSARAREAFRRVEGAANRMAQLTSQLLAYAGRGRFVTELVDPDELVHEAHEQLSHIVHPDADLELALGPKQVVIEADRGLLHQVLVNIVANASDALHAGGRIEVSTRVADGWWTLQVKDTGIGMEPETVERMFDPFFTTKPSHHGLGLSAVSGIVRRLGGETHVVSQPSEGTTFQVRLRVVESGLPQRRGDSSRMAVPTLAGIHVLVADDEPTVRATTRRLLERRGATVVTASDGAEAAALLREDRFTVVLLDVMMPHMTGYQLLPLAREAQPKARLMLMSGYTDARRGSGAEDEPDAFLEKPFSASVLDAAVDRLLARPNEI